MKNELSAANQQQAFGIAVLLLVLVISPVIIFLVGIPLALVWAFITHPISGAECHGDHPGVLCLPVPESPRAENGEKKGGRSHLPDAAPQCGKGNNKVR